MTANDGSDDLEAFEEWWGQCILAQHAPEAKPLARAGWLASRSRCARPEEPPTELQKKVAAFSMLPDGWNSYGAKAFPKETITLAMEVARKLGPEWKTVPVADGGIEFYRSNEDEIIEVRTCFDSLAPQDGLPK